MEKTRLDLRTARLRLRNTHDAPDQEWPAAQKLQDLESLITLADEMVSPIRRGHVACKIGNCPDPMHIGWSRIGHLRVALHENADLALLPDDLLCGSD